VHHLNKLYLDKNLDIFCNVIYYFFLKKVGCSHYINQTSFCDYYIDDCRILMVRPELTLSITIAGSD
jgi:hypothetical protein